jgi:phosphatidate cytidylyltransferase
MLRNRIITASILAPLVIAAILFLSPDGFALVWGLIILLGAWEWANLAMLAGLQRIVFTVVILAVMVAARLFAMDWAPGELPVWLYGGAALWWAVWGTVFRRSADKVANRKFSVATRVIAGFWVLTTGWILLVWLRLNFSEYQVLYLLLLIWVADIAAYFTGKRWGFTKLMAAISPGKTVEGVYGAMFGAILFALPVGFGLGFDTMTLIDFVFLSLMTVAFSVCGDLFESLAKRVRGVKDSGSMLPGHGGVLDRIDSLLAGVSVFYAGSLLIPIFIQFGASLEPELIMQPEDAPAIESEAPDHHYDGPMEVPSDQDEVPPPAPEDEKVAPVAPKTPQSVAPSAPATPKKGAAR